MGELVIVSRSDLLFRDRREAGQLLARELVKYAGADTLALGIPRGGVIVAQELARGLGAELDVVLARKLRTPGHAELAMGAIAEDGKAFLNDEVISTLQITGMQIENEKALQMAEIARRAQLFRQARPRAGIKGRTMIITDDGVATGATTLAAIWAARQAGPRTLIAALPVGPEDTLRRLADEADLLVCLRVPRHFNAVGQFYLRFHPVDDEEVLRILKEEAGRRVSSNLRG